ncbi:MAG: type III-A CRISPR-associated protein Csm2 [Lachnospiraceae bacterium]|nr:type III-A CRISPR-associated protein Csm2 [Lachnospiraceae bacterium]
MNTISEMTYVDQAEEVIQRLRAKKNPRTGRAIPMVTTSKIRNLLAMTSDIYNELLNEQGSEIPDTCRERIEYLRIRVIYEAGREDSVRSFVEEAKLSEILKEIGNNRKKYMLYSRYMEALVAFHKFYGGREQ